jgi:lysophospholipase L1-like esterase
MEEGRPKGRIKALKNVSLKISVGANVLLIAALVASAWTAVFVMTSFAEDHNERRQTQFAELSPHGGIVFLGDSITEGGIWDELFERRDVWNRGVSGNTTAHLLERLDTIVAIEPRQIFLMIGVNDLNRDVPPARTEQNYREILDTLARRLPECRVVVQSVLPVAPDWIYTSNREIRSLNETIARNAGERGLVLVDLHTRFADDDGNLPSALTNDGIHLLGPAYSIWRDAIAALLLPPD